MALPVINLVEQMSQLDAARNLVLGDAAFYPQIVQGILPIIGSNARVELRRWGAEFLAETFSSPAFPQQPKQKLSTQVLGILGDLLDISGEDTAVVRNVIQAASSIYPLIFRHIIDHPDDHALWEKMTAIKQNILNRWDSSPHNVKVCCIKFVQKVVQVQTTGVIADPRRPEQNETSLALVPRNHPLVPLPNLEAEASGLLDRLLNVFHENSSDPILVNATINCMAVLIRTRQSISSKILNAMLNFNPLKQTNAPMTPTLRVNVISMERTTRALFINVMKRNPNHPLAPRMQQYIERLAQARNEIFEEAPKKRALPTEPTDVVDSAKRARLGVETPPQLKIPALPPGPNSYAQLFTLTEDVGLTSFDVKQLPLDLIVKIVVPVLTRVDPEALDQAVGAVRSRYLTLCKKQAYEHRPPVAPAAEEEEEEYEPEYEPADISVPAEEAMAVSTEPADQAPDFVALGPFVLPQPPPLSEEEANEIGKETVQRVFSMIATLDQPAKPPKGSASTQQLGFGRLAASSFDQDSWLALLTRLATRATAGLELDEEDEIRKVENGHQSGQMVAKQRVTMADAIREMLYRYVLQDFRVRMNVAISWMNEEWYNDQIQLKQAGAENGGDLDGAAAPRHYERWVVRLLEGILPYLDARDKVLIRFLSEIPDLIPALVEKVKTLANDPERVNLCVQAFYYLVLMRPPARELCLDALQDLYEKIEDARPLVSKVLVKWRPHVLPQSENLQSKEATPQLPAGGELADRSISATPATGATSSGANGLKAPNGPEAVATTTAQSNDNNSESQQAQISQQPPANE
ncbi:hypothetical protein AJ80_07889 [Polytolypa hystricis UAMH7299]|uniref:Symplekin/Pta1 N-terminal domain-containing protein n=1 Tax=Polytolypa hystricis (strain UAMH7299) TaxID=1447883 RepID=A0A2B7XHP5_POLH7|nr:hypothetical protein AJ80_07889 [Polytolypa hystricis UAMH7299]